MFEMMALFALCCLLSVFFSRAATASTATSLLFLLLFFPYFGVSGGNTSSGVKGFMCLSAPLCFGLGLDTILALEIQGTGVNPNTASTHIMHGLSFNSCMGLLALDFWLYLLFGAWPQHMSTLARLHDAHGCACVLTPRPTVTVLCVRASSVVFRQGFAV